MTKDKLIFSLTHKTRNYKITLNIHYLFLVITEIPIRKHKNKTPKDRYRGTSHNRAPTDGKLNLNI